uniref:Hypothetical TPR repeat protein n=1 Tax=uncultured prokaryote AT3 TaxID=672202 RepID=D3W8G8_9ZZZZ|nr:hypothetical TPR repeat protein [uncultured prokaryote AT3]
MTTLSALEKLLDGPRDNALLRFGLGNEYLKAGNADQAISLYQSAVERDPNYSAAWKALGKTLAGAGRKAEARLALQRGIEVAEARGDIQASKEMNVFLRRLERS